jgi:site-specific recombinase XerD
MLHLERYRAAVQTVFRRAQKRVSLQYGGELHVHHQSFFNWCVAQNLCRRNPAIEVQLDRIDHKGRNRFADLELTQRLIQNAPNDDLRFVLFCGLHTGMRKSEIV